MMRKTSWTRLIREQYVKRAPDAEDKYDVAIFGQLGFVRVNGLMYVKLICTLKERVVYGQVKKAA